MTNFFFSIRNEGKLNQTKTKETVYPFQRHHFLYMCNDFVDWQQNMHHWGWGWTKHMKLISLKCDLLVLKIWFICFPVGQIHLSHCWTIRQIKRIKMFNSSNDRQNQINYYQTEKKSSEKQFKCLIFSRSHLMVWFWSQRAESSGCKRQCSMFISDHLRARDCRLQWNREQERTTEKEQ